jgi:hypothetical protein
MSDPTDCIDPPTIIGSVDWGTTPPELRALVEQQDAAMRRGTAALRDHVLQGVAEIHLALAEVGRGSRTWWQRYAQHVGPGEVKARCRKILLRQIDEWTPHPKLEADDEQDT